MSVYRYYIVEIREDNSTTNRDDLGYFASANAAYYAAHKVLGERFYIEFEDAHEEFDNG